MEIARQEDLRFMVFPQGIHHNDPVETTPSKCPRYSDAIDVAILCSGSGYDEKTEHHSGQAREAG